MGRLVSAFLALATLTTLGCELSTAPLPHDAVPFNPPSVYARWWALTEQCAGLTANLSAVSWYVVPDSVLHLQDGTEVDGFWLARDNRIVLTSDDVLDGPLVRHEMLHAISRGDGHARDLFVENCGGVVVCANACLTDAGPPPPENPAAIHVPQDDVTVTIAMSDSAPSSLVNQGMFMMIVTATNTLDVPIVADQSTPNCFLCAEAAFGFRYYGDAANFVEVQLLPETPEQRRFEPGATKRYVFDFRNRPLDDGRFDGVAPGGYLFAGGYGGRWTDGVPITVLP